MSVQVTKAILKAFLTSTETDVLALTGSWGTGKTYAWCEALIEHKKEIKFKNYCYVSLFGINTMSELRMALFTKSEAVATLGEKIDFNTVNEHWRSIAKDWMKGQYGRFAPMFKSLPHGSSISLGLEALAPFAVRDTLVCFDDFERQTNIKAEDVLGLITELREERGCKVALIFNAEQLRNKETYLTYREKAIDFEVLYSPTVQEAFELVFDEGFPGRDIVLRHVVDLEITNVRLLRKLRQVILRIKDVTNNMHADVFATSIATSVLLCWCAYAPDASKPRIEEIESWNKSLTLFNKGSQESETLAWVSRLKAYGFVRVDDLDLSIARIVERGYIEGTGFTEVAKNYDDNCRNIEESTPFTSAWHSFHNSFDGDDRTFALELHEASVKAIAQIRVVDLNGTVQMLRDLNREDLSDDLIDKFVAANKNKPAVFDLNMHPFGGSIDDAKLRSIFQTIHTNQVKLPSLKESIIFMAKHSSYNAEHLEAMKRASVDDYQSMFMEKHTDVGLPSVIKWTLRWENTENADITIKAKEALTRIKGSNLLNAIRVARYGV